MQKLTPSADGVYIHKPSELEWVFKTTGQEKIG
jgi:hypothetical protein